MIAVVPLAGTWIETATDILTQKHRGGLFTRLPLVNE